MTRYEYFNEGFARVGMELGVVSVNDFTKFVRYQVYLDLRAQGLPSTDAVIQTGDRCRCCRATVYNSIKYFQESKNS